MEQSDYQTPFQSLTPDTVITLAETALGIRCTNLCRSLMSYINRVYELEIEDGPTIIAKFYRPHRWSAQGLQDEHNFLIELADQEIPVIAPLKLKDNNTLGYGGDFYFALFPKMGGRSFDEFSDDQWLQLGRLLGRFHAVGARHLPQDRITMTPDCSTRQQLDYLIHNSFIPSDLLPAFCGLADEMIAMTTPLFDGMDLIRIHGDCHFSNLIYRPHESFYIIDLDDMAVGPPVQDFWMLLPGYQKDSLAEIEMFLEGYETFHDFNRRSLRLIEPLRAMRFIHYAAWCARQMDEDGEARVVPDFGTHSYWQRRIADLADQLERIKTAVLR
ncbi:MAG: serine/threonine protein kinase [Desulfobulbaceae bacterium]|nr:serine/threonine protein kinase [Desulfobulbaceae bacterium]